MIRDIYYLLRFLFRPEGTYLNRVSMEKLTVFKRKGFKMYVADDTGGYWMPVGVLGSRYLRVSRNTALEITASYRR